MAAETQQQLDKLLSIQGNNKCIDCDATHPKWASLNNGVFICIDCAGNHRSMGVHISFVRSITLDTWNQSQLNRMKFGGNEKLKQFWEEQKFFQLEYARTLSAKERLDNEAMDKYRENLLKLAKNEAIQDIAFIGYKQRQIQKKKNDSIQGIGNTTYAPQKKQKHFGKKASKMIRYGVKAKLALTRTLRSDEAQEITQCKVQLKDQKHWMHDVEEIANNLYNAQTELIRGFGSGSALTSLKHNANDKFGVFLNNMGRITANLEESYQIYLMNMEDQLLKPLHEFNTKEIEKCQKIKLKLKTVKGNYDIAKQHEDKLANRKNSNSSTHAAHMQKAQLELMKKESELTLVCNEFILAIKKLEDYQSNELLSSVQSYFESLETFSKIQSQSLCHNEMNEMIVERKENQYENEVHMILKEGWMNKRGGGHKSKKFKRRYFKLFTNKKLAYYPNDGNCKPKGHADLTFVMLRKIDDLSLSIQTQKRLFVFQCETAKERDEWYDIIQIKCIKDLNDDMIPTHIIHDQNELNDKGFSSDSHDEI